MKYTILLAALGRAATAKQAYARAIGLSEDMAVRDLLVAQRERLG